METSNISNRKLLRYFLSHPPKTLNPYLSLLSSNHSHIFPSRYLSSCNLYTQNLHKKPYICNSSNLSPSNSSRNFSFYIFSCGLSSKWYFDSCQACKNQSLCNSSNGSSSNSLKNLSLHNLSCLLPSKCNLDAYPLHKKRSLCNFSHGSSSNSFKNLSLHNLSCGLPSKCNIDAYQLHKRQSLCKSSYGSSSNWPLKHPILTSTVTLNMYMCSSSYRGLFCGNVGLIKARFGSAFQFFSASSRDGNVTFNKENEHEEVDTSDFVGFLGELKGNDVHIVDANPRSPERNRLVAAKPLSEQFRGGLESSSFHDVEKRRNVVSERISEITGIIRSNDHDMERKLSSVVPNLSLRSITVVFEALNCQNVSGLRFFRWVQFRNYNLCRTAGFYSLIINNCGWLSDYETMELLLRECRSGKICLTEKAFEFLPLFCSSKDSVKDSIKCLVDMLNGVGGSCRNSGIHALIQMLCRLGLFDMAKFVIEITERTVSHYKILIREKCSRGRIEEAHSIIKEMRELGCDPDTSTYNYILGSLCKIDKINEAWCVLEEMKEKGISPDAISFEIFISYLCGLGKFGRVCQLLDQMVSEGVQPRLTTHAIIIKALFKAEQYEEACRYVIDSSLKDPSSSNMVYSLLAKLHQKNRDPISALKIILELMDKGLQPQYSVYMDVVSRLERSGMGSLANDLKNRYSKFTSASHIPTA